MKVYIAGHNGMVGGALVRRFKKEPNTQLLLRTRKELDLTSQSAVDAFYAAEKPDVAIIAAAKVGGIHANNTYPAEFLFENLAIAANAVHSAYRHGVKFHSAMPTNLYGPGDNYHLQNSHVLPALIRKFHEAKEAGRDEVVAWGTGKPMREFLHVDDLADACAFLLQMEDPPDWINVGTGTDVTIKELTETVAAVTNFKGRITWDTSKPDGTPRKLMDVSRLTGLGWKARIGLREGVEKTYASFLEETAAGALRA